jgi:hypothetical protein
VTVTGKPTRFELDYPAHAAALNLLAMAVPEAERPAFRASIVEWVRDATISASAEVPDWMVSYDDGREARPHEPEMPSPDVS